jgi:HTH-type transcriptional repressor of NAD biosynthesis genes
MTTGFIVGKFYPFHRGHKYLIDTARKLVDDLVVVVAAKPRETIPGVFRYEWLRETFAFTPNVDVGLIENDLPDDDHQAWANFTKDYLGYVPDFVFTSEDYGEGWAKALGSTHVQVDKARVEVPVSGTMIRANPLGYLDYLEPCVREYYVKRVVLVGAESCGKTTLAEALASEYCTKWVPEYGRPFSEWFHTPNDLWESMEFTHIAKVQNEVENIIARRANKVLFCDTNAATTALWHQRYMGEPSQTCWHEYEFHKKPDLYVLCGTEVGFHQDEYGLRDRPEGREKMQGDYYDWLRSQMVPFILVSGRLQDRVMQVKEAVDVMLSQREPTNA